ncbi:MAG: pyridoxamine 5'-phosphate oxidase family protein [Myxococcota bacterium]|nr:pyridoxamine 5'-phosphate oxidase family protein [Myxococcota bacterium]
MSADLQDYEAVSIYPLDEAEREALLVEAKECVFMWSTREGWPIGVIMSCLWRDGRMWLTAGAHRHRISAVRRDPRVSVVVTSAGTQRGPGCSITFKGRCVVHEDRETKDWFYPAFSGHLLPVPRHAEAFQKRLDSPLRVVLEVIPEKFITYDGTKMARDTAGRLSDDEKGPALSADSERLPRELRRRGLAQD